jgi:two-component system response regulator MprA
MSDPNRLILLVDDDEDIRHALSEVIHLLGIPVIEAANGAEALTILRTGCIPSLILLDLRMPVMSGEEFYSVLRHEARWDGIAVVVLSADSDAARIATTLGVAGFLRKPVELSDLVEVLTRFRETDPRLLPLR